MASIVSPTGYIDLDNDCQYSIDLKSTRSRESVNPKEDLAFYFNTYITPKYGLENINVNNCASFMKDLEMNWTKLTPDLKQKVLDIMVDGIIEPDMQKSLQAKLSNVLPPNILPAPAGVSTFGKSKSTFGSSSNNILLFVFGFIILGLAIFLIDRFKTKTAGFSKLS